jgi:hypothetical protein
MPGEEWRANTVGSCVLSSDTSSETCVILFWNRCVGTVWGVSMSNEDQTTALVAGETLSYQRDGEDYQLPVGTSAWYTWLPTATRFRVRSPLGTFTMRREQAGHKHGAWYWRAYRKHDGKLQRVYVGKGEEVTLQRLHAVARQLFGQGKQKGNAEAEWTHGVLHSVTER